MDNVREKEIKYTVSVRISGKGYVNVRPFYTTEDAMNFYEVNMKNERDIFMKEDYKILKLVMCLAVNCNVQWVVVKRNEAEDHRAPSQWVTMELIFPNMEEFQKFHCNIENVARRI